MLLKNFFYRMFFMLLIACCMGLNEAQAQGQLAVAAVYTQAPCDHDGIVTASVTNGTPPYSYTWSYYNQNTPPVITSVNTLNNASGAQIQLIVTDAAGGIGYAWVNQAFPFYFYPTITAANCPLSDGSIDVGLITGGTSPFTYSWYNNGVFLSAGTNSILSNLPPGGQYDVKIVDAAGCSLWASEVDSLNSYTIGSINNILANAVTTPANCVNGTATVNPINGTSPYSYVWKEYFTNTTLPFTGNTASSLVASHYYTVDITDANGCIKTEYIYMNTSLTYSATGQVTPEHCDDADGTAMAIPQGNATSPYTYSWATNPTQTTQTASNLNSGYYQCFMVSANGCEITETIYVPLVSPVNVTYTMVGSNNCNAPNGTATLTPTGGTAPYTYSWANGQTTQTATGLSPGFYFFEVTDATGCSKTGTVPVSQLTPVSATIATVPTSSCISPNGQATINATAGTSPYSYSWSNGQTTQTATGLSANTNYHFWATDATGCVTGDNMQVGYSGNLQVNVATTPDVCSGGTGTATANVTGGLTPYTYSWITGQTTASLTNLNQGTYQCQVVDANGCADWDTSYVSYFSPINFTTTVTDASCLYVADGSITINATGGTAPYSYNLLNGNITQSSPTFTGLMPQYYYNNGTYYYFTITDANGCIKNSNSTYVGYNNNVASCVGTISGVVYDDLNQNCVQDAGETGIPNTLVSCVGFGCVWTNNSGYYEFTVPVGTYNVAHYPSLYHKAQCPANGMQTVNMPLAGTIVTNNFADSTTLVNDLRVNTYNYTLPVPGFDYFQHIVYQNIGTTPITNAEPRHVYDNELNINYTTPTPLSTIYTPEEQTFGTMTLQPTAYFDVFSSYYVPTNVPLGTVLTYQDTALPVAGDVTFWDNHDFHQPIVASSFDPNYKEVSPKGEGAEGFITVNDSILEYVIHFQNTGTAPAHNVTLIDTLDTDLELTSIEMGYGTHNYVAKISENRVLEIYFPNIMLPDSGADMVGSNGFVAFRIKQKKNLPMGTQFTNQAGIIFDFNYPIYTNTTLNTLHELTSVEKPIIETLGLFPNPAQNVLNIEIPYELQGQDLTFECLDLTGKVVMSKQNIHAGKTEISVAELSQGWYFARVIGNNTLLNGKFVIVR